MTGRLWGCSWDELKYSNYGFLMAAYQVTDIEVSSWCKHNVNKLDIMWSVIWCFDEAAL